MFWIAGRRFTSTPRRLSARAPWVRLSVTIAGSSSGVRPTASAIAKRSESRSGSVQREVDREDRDHEDRRHPEHQAAEGPDAALEVVLRRPFREVTRDLAVARPGAGRGDHGAAGAAHDAGSEEGEAVAIVRTGRPERGRRAAYFGDGADSPVSDASSMYRWSASTIRTSAGTMSPAPSSTRSSRTTSWIGHVLPRAVAHDGRVQRQAGLERGDRRLGPGLLDEPERRAHRDDREDDRGRHGVADHEADQARCDEDQHERARDLRDEDRQERPAPAAADGVRAVPLKAIRGLGSGQPWDPWPIDARRGRGGRRRLGSARGCHV